MWQFEVDCFSSCTSPVIEIQLSPAGTSWDVESSDGIADYKSYRSGNEYMKIPVELGQLYRLKAQYNNIERTSDVISFTSLDAKCSEIIDIKMDSYSILLDDACSDSNWKEVIINNKTFIVMITFHPAYLLRQADQKKYSWVDLKEIRKKINELKFKI